MRKRLITGILSVSISLALTVSAFAFDSVKNGDKGDAVAEIQKILIEKGYLTGDADGSFGPKTEEAVSAFQKDNNLDATGIVDEASYNALVGQPEEAAEEKETEKQEDQNADNPETEAEEAGSDIVELFGEEEPVSFDTTELTEGSRLNARYTLPKAWDGMTNQNDNSTEYFFDTQDGEVLVQTEDADYEDFDSLSEEELSAALDEFEEALRGSAVEYETKLSEIVRINGRLALHCEDEIFYENQPWDEAVKSEGFCFVDHSVRYMFTLARFPYCTFDPVPNFYAMIDSIEFAETE